MATLYTGVRGLLLDNFTLLSNDQSTTNFIVEVDPIFVAVYICKISVEPLK